MDPLPGSANRKRERMPKYILALKVPLVHDGLGNGHLIIGRAEDIIMNSYNPDDAKKQNTSTAKPKPKPKPKAKATSEPAGDLSAVCDEEEGDWLGDDLEETIDIKKDDACLALGGGSDGGDSACEDLDEDVVGMKGTEDFVFDDTCLEADPATELRDDLAVGFHRDLAEPDGDVDDDAVDCMLESEETPLPVVVPKGSPVLQYIAPRVKITCEEAQQRLHDAKRELERRRSVYLWDESHPPDDGFLSIVVHDSAATLVLWTDSDNCMGRPISIDARGRMKGILPHLCKPQSWR
ncbi:hypothetical protein N9L19_00605 [bacterium]|nr:hypothetical protein [bacterium]